jgi:hypothetical protein
MSKLTEFFKKVNKTPWFGTVKKIAPTLAAGLAGGGPIGAAAVQVLMGVLDVKGDPNDPGTLDQISEVMASGDLSKLEALKLAEQKFVTDMKKLDLDEQSLYLQDVASAREREKAVRDKTPTILSYLAVGMWLFCIYAIFFAPDLEIIKDRDQRDVLLYLLGVTQTLVVTAYSYYLGSSRGSLAKTEAMVAQLRHGPAPDQNGTGDDREK